MTPFEINKIFCQKILGSYEGIYERVTNYNFADYEVIISYEDDSSTFLTRTFKLDKYRYAVYIKEIIEQYAKDLGLKGVWIDLNDLSKDERYYFRNCIDVYTDLNEYEKIKSLKLIII